ncbi:C-type lectin domain family 2 member D [Chelonia mydas]|uniref:C-type lectin domain family 2 member D n=1 Tax=Chelonia mydas TaxID=8469 RepID=M7C179_CHEMY|nr:C-type lectin domain family 2 member D [Chelonia mydas]
MLNASGASADCIKDAGETDGALVVHNDSSAYIVEAAATCIGQCTCSKGWIGYQGKCYYFSETEGNWNNSRSHCSALNASLAGIDSDQEKDFLLCYKGFLDRWISLQRKPGQAWRWPNGTKFDNRFPIRGGGKCAFLMDENWFGSSRCMKWRHLICCKPDVYTMGKGCIVESKV